MSLNKRYRPLRFDDVVGQDVAKMVLRKVAHNPVGKPQVYLLCGEFGSGKSTLGRIFGRAINCTSKDSKPCLKCKPCLEYPNDGRYSEYDSAMVGNVKEIRSLRESLMYHSLSGYKVVLFDEAHAVSREGQVALLEITENPPENMFILFCSTEKERMIKPLVSRAFELEFGLLKDSDMGSAIDRVLRSENMEVSDPIKKVIMRRASGHVRDAISLVERYSILGEEEFLKSVIVVDTWLKRLVIESAKGNKTEVQNVIKVLSEIPLSILNQDLTIFLKNMMQYVYMNEKPLWDIVTEKLLGRVFLLYIQFSPVLRKSTSDFVCFLNALTALIENEKRSRNVDVSVERFQR